MLNQVASETNFGSGSDRTAFLREVAARLGGSWGLAGSPGYPYNDTLAWYTGPNANVVMFTVLTDGNELQWRFKGAEVGVWLDPVTLKRRSEDDDEETGPGPTGPLPQIPRNLDPRAIKVGEQVATRIFNTGAFAEVGVKGKQASFGILAISAVAAVAADWAIKLALKVPKKPPTEDDKDELDDRIQDIFS
jgi:hypothetical protein